MSQVILPLSENRSVAIQGNRLLRFSKSNLGQLGLENLRDLLVVQVPRGLLLEVTCQVSCLSPYFGVRNRIDHDDGFARDDELLVTVDSRFEAKPVSAESFDDDDGRGEFVPECDGCDEFEVL